MIIYGSNHEREILNAVASLTNNFNDEISTAICHDLADLLNSKKIGTASGKLWTAGNIYSFLNYRAKTNRMIRIKRRIGNQDVPITTPKNTIVSKSGASDVDYVFNSNLPDHMKVKLLKGLIAGVL